VTAAAASWRARDRVEAAVARALAALPPRAQLALAGGRAVARDGDQLAPDVQLVLAVRRRLRAPTFDALSVEEARRAFRRDTLLHAGPRVAVGAVRDADLAAPGTPPLRARHYAPPHAAGAPPLLVWLHGGGHVIGDLDTHDPVCGALCRGAGVHVLSVDYRLAPEHPFPADVEDACRALAWAADHARDLGADPARVAIGGDSAGGTLAAVAARLALRERHAAPALQLLVYPAADRSRAHRSLDLFGDGFLLTRAEIAWFHRHYVESAGADRADPRVSPLLAPDLSGLAPAIVVTAAFDPLRDEGEAYAAALAAAGTPTTLRRMRGLVHGFVNMGGVSRTAREAIGAIARLLGDGLAARAPHPGPLPAARGEGDHLAQSDLPCARGDRAVLPRPRGAGERGGERGP
jgi:acetyl esterase